MCPLHAPVDLLYELDDEKQNASIDPQENTMYANDEYDSYQQEVMHEILDECNEYADNCQRSEDEGWFYPDEDAE